MSGLAAAKRKTVTRRPAARRGERVGHILGESLKCFAEQGFERVTYDELIARSKVSRGSFYWYFPSKEALYDAVLDYCVSGYVARLEAAFAQTDAGDHVVRRLLRACRLPYLTCGNSDHRDAPHPSHSARAFPAASHRRLLSRAR